MLSVKKDLAALRNDAIFIFKNAIKTVQAETAVKRHCRLSLRQLEINGSLFDLAQYQHIYVIGAGKASAHMGKAIEDLLLPEITEGLIVVKYGHALPLKKIRVIEAGHPMPDGNGVKGARNILKLAEKATKNDLIICLISGGGSALLSLPARPLTLSDKQNTIKTLFACGASIEEINTLRKHMSMIKGGKLAQKAYPAALITLMLSDVIGDRADIIASGPAVPDPGTFQDCMAIIDQYDIKDKMPARVIELITKGISGKIDETPKPGDPVFSSSAHLVIANNKIALSEAKRVSESLGYHTMILSSMIAGNTREAALFHAAIAKEIRKSGNPVPSPACILSGGETTVILKGNGLGGRNQEFALASAIDLKNEKNIVVLSAGTDGTDGPTDAAGAVIDTTLMQKAIALGIRPGDYLKNNDSFHFFQKTNGLLFTGPTGTNVMDLRIILVG